MRYAKWIIGMGLALATMVPSLSAAEFHRSDRFDRDRHDRREVAYERYDARHYRFCR